MAGEVLDETQNKLVQVLKALEDISVRNTGSDTTFIDQHRSSLMDGSCQERWNEVIGFA